MNVINKQELRIFAQSLLKKGLSPYLFYHDYEHTREVVKNALYLAETEKISDHEMNILEMAAWFHDTGFINTYQHHEEESCSIATAYLTEKGASAEEINDVCRLIHATKVPQNPKTLLEKIICDADLCYLGSDAFTEISGNLKKEWLHYGILKNEYEFIEKQLKFLSHHQYFTETARREIEPKKRLILQELLREKPITQNQMEKT